MHTNNRLISNIDIFVINIIVIIITRGNVIYYATRFSLRNFWYRFAAFLVVVNNLMIIFRIWLLTETAITFICIHRDPRFPVHQRFVIGHKEDIWENNPRNLSVFCRKINFLTPAHLYTCGMILYNNYLHWSLILLVAAQTENLTLQIC